MEVEGLEAVDAPPEVSMDGLLGVLGELTVEEGL